MEDRKRRVILARTVPQLREAVTSIPLVPPPHPSVVSAAFDRAAELLGGAPQRDASERREGWELTGSLEGLLAATLPSMGPGRLGVVLNALQSLEAGLQRHARQKRPRDGLLEDDAPSQERPRQGRGSGGGGAIMSPTAVAQMLRDRLMSQHGLGDESDPADPVAGLRRLATALSSLAWLRALDGACIRAVAPQLERLLRSLHPTAAQRVRERLGERMRREEEEIRRWAPWWQGDRQQQQQQQQQHDRSSPGQHAQRGPQVERPSEEQQQQQRQQQQQQQQQQQDPAMPVSKILWLLWRALALARQHDPSTESYAPPGALSALRAATGAEMGRMSLRQIAGVLDSMAHVGNYSERLVGGLLAEAAGRLRGEPPSPRQQGGPPARDAGAAGGRAAQAEEVPRSVTRLLAAAAAHRHYDAAALDAICSAAERLAPEFELSDTCDAIWALGRLSHRHETLLRELCRRVAAEAASVSILDLSLAACGLAYLDCCDGDAIGAISSEVGRRWGVAPRERAKREQRALGGRRRRGSAQLLDPTQQQQQQQHHQQHHQQEEEEGRIWRPGVCVGAGPASVTPGDPLQDDLVLFRFLQVHCWLESRGRPGVLPASLLPAAWAAARRNDRGASHAEAGAVAALRAAGCGVEAPFEAPGLPIHADAAVTALGPGIWGAEEAALPRTPPPSPPPSKGQRWRPATAGAGADGAARGYGAAGPVDAGPGAPGVPRGPLLILLEVDGPRHFARNVSRRPMGHTLWRNRLLCANGYCLVTLSVEDWDEAVALDRAAERTGPGSRSSAGRLGSGSSGGGDDGGDGGGVVVMRARVQLLRGLLLAAILQSGGGVGSG